MSSATRTRRHSVPPPRWQAIGTEQRELRVKLADRIERLPDAVLDREAGRHAQSRQQACREHSKQPDRECCNARQAGAKRSRVSSGAVALLDVGQRACANEPGNGQRNLRG